MPTMALNGIDLYYEAHGTQQAGNNNCPLMLIAGLASDSQSWLPVLSRLAETRMVILFDSRGCGRTAPQDSANSIHLIAEDCVALADHLGIDRFDLVGHSMGGFTAIDCALNHPRRIARLVLANSAASNGPRNALLFDDWLDDLRLGLNPERWFRTFFYWIFTPRFFDKPSKMDDFLRFALDYPHPQTAAGFAAQLEAMHDVDLSDALGRLDIETLVLCSALDAIFPPGEDAAGLAGLPRSRVVVVPGQAHALHVEAPALFLEPVLAFLN